MSPPLRVTASPAWGWCVGLRHPPVAEYPAGMFSAAQLTEMEADAALTLEPLPGEAELAAVKAAMLQAEAAAAEREEAALLRAEMEAAEGAEAQAREDAEAAARAAAAAPARAHRKRQG